MGIDISVECGRFDPQFLTEFKNMAHRTILTERQRSALFDLPTDEAAMLRHYTLADDDLEAIRARRRPHNRFGFAL